MAHNIIIFEFMECDNEEQISNRHRRRRIREDSDPFIVLNESEFIRRYRLSKQLVLDLCEEIRPLFSQPIKTTDLTVEQKVLTTLSFYATGSYQRPTGDIGAHSMAQQTVSAVIAEVTAHIDSEVMRRKYICFPKKLQESNKTRARFYQQFKMPGVLGCIDCTQIAIVRPADHEERYYCRKHYHSLNVQLICDADMQITSIDASYGGATHDSFIWDVHPLKTHLENLTEATWLLGDSGYPLRKYLMTPIVDAVPETLESHYTELHVKTRNIIERTIGLLKARFRCLLVHRVLHYKPTVAGKIVNACAILHNICNKANIPVPDYNNDEMLQEAQIQAELSSGRVYPGGTNNEALQLGIATRNNLIHRLDLQRTLVPR